MTSTPFPSKEPAIALSFGKNRYDNEPTRWRGSVSDFFRRLENTRRGTLTVDNYIEANKEIQLEEKDGPFFIPAVFTHSETRSERDIEEITGFVLDLDRGDWEQDDIAEKLKDMRFKAYATHSSLPIFKKWRVFLPYARPTKTKEQHLAVWKYFQGLFGDDLDSRSETMNQVWFLPSCPPDLEFVCFEGEGLLFDPLTVAPEPKKVEQQQSKDGPLLKALREADLVKSRDHRPGTWLVTCPWSDKHTGGDDGGTFYYEPNFGGFSGEGFKCFHDHCGERDAAAAKERLGVIEDGNPKKEALLKNNVFVAGLKRFVYLKHMTQYDQETFSAMNAVAFPLGKGKGRPAAATVFLNDSRGHKLERVTYLPGGERFVVEEGIECLNTWLPSDVVPVEGDVFPFLEHAEYVIPNDDARNVVFDWMAWILKKPAEKPNWGVLLGGPQGIGKDALFDPLERCLGNTNWRVITPDDLNSGWTDWLASSRLIVVEEMAHFGKREMANRLKPLLTAPPFKLRINTKMIPQYEVPNRVAFVFFTNEEDALLIDDEDRRFFVYWSEAKPNDPKYYAHYFKWVEKNAGAVYHWLLNRDLSDFNAKGNPPSTTHKQQMIEESRTPLERFVRDQIEAQAFPFAEDLVVINDLLEVLPRHVGKATTHSVGKALRRVGAEKLGQVEMKDGSRPWLWAIRDAVKYRRMKAELLRETYGKPLLSNEVSWYEHENQRC